MGAMVQAYKSVTVIIFLTGRYEYLSDELRQSIARTVKATLLRSERL